MRSFGFRSRDWFSRIVTTFAGVIQQGTDLYADDFAAVGTLVIFPASDYAGCIG